MPALGWEVWHRVGYLPETMPISDYREHEFGSQCWCRPFTDCETLVHNSLDGREHYETGKRRLS